MAKKGKKKIGCIIFIVIFIAVIAGLVIFLMKMASKGIAMMNSMPYGEVAVKDLSEYVNVSGNVSSSDSYNVTAEVLQKVTKLNVKVGDSVKRAMSSASLIRPLCRRNMISWLHPPARHRMQNPTRAAFSAVI